MYITKDFIDIKLNKRSILQTLKTNVFHKHHRTPKRRGTPAPRNIVK
jgi:hypothetical protein